MNKTGQRKTVLILGGFTFILTLLYLGLAVIIAYVVEDTVIERILSLEVENIREDYFATNRISKPQMNFIKLYQSAESLPEPVRQMLLKSPRAKEVFTDSSDHYHIKSFTLDQKKHLWLLANVTPLLVVSNLSNKILFLFFLVFIIAFSAALYSAKKIAYLSMHLEQTLERLNSALQREKHFTRDVSHELRTPLTVIKNTLLLIGQREFRESDVKNLSIASVDMENIINVLLELAREESSNTTSCGLRASVESAAMICAEQQSIWDFDIDIGINSHVTLTVNPTLLRILLSNIIGNAVLYSSEPHMSIAYQDEELSFSNPISCIDKQASNIAKPGIKAKSSQGIGQGLYLVERIIHAFGWSYEIQQSETVFSLKINMSADKKLDNFT